MQTHERKPPGKPPSRTETGQEFDPEQPFPKPSQEERKRICQELSLTLEADKESRTMGKVLVSATIENLDDLFVAGKGGLPEDKIRRVVVTDALIDTGATGLLVPSKLIAQLGLDPIRVRTAKTIVGQTPLRIYRAVRLTVQGRDCISDVAEIPDDCTVMIGQVPLELMDWVIDPRGQRLIGNPEHSGEHMIEA
jgi:predicted aspartyl protease